MTAGQRARINLASGLTAWLCTEPGTYRVQPSDQEPPATDRPNVKVVEQPEGFAISYCERGTWVGGQVLRVTREQALRTAYESWLDTLSD